jgi:hypothetical protein
MANIISNVITVSGPLQSLKALSKRLYINDFDTLYYDPDGRKMEYDENLLGFEPVWITGPKISVHDVADVPFIKFFSQTKWGSPTIALDKLSSDFPALDFENAFVGEGPVYGRYFYKGGSEQNEPIDDPVEIEKLLDEVFTKTRMSPEEEQDTKQWYREAIREQILEEERFHAGKLREEAGAQENSWITPTLLLTGIVGYAAIRLFKPRE